MKVAVKNLSIGLHEIDLGEFDATSIELPESELYPNKIKINLIIDRFDSAYRFKIFISTKAKYQCDRCLDFFDFDFEAAIEQIYEAGNENIGIDEDVRTIATDDREIDISDVVIEAFTLFKPVKILCREDCKGLCPDCGINLNHKSCTCTHDTIDPRLEKLRSLLN